METVGEWLVQLFGRRLRMLLPPVLFLLAIVSGCGDRPPPLAKATQPPPPRPAPQGSVTLTFAAFATPREAYEKRIVPEFQRYWRKAHGQDVQFVQSYAGSAAQARSIVGGAEADVAALSLAQDLDLIAQAGLIHGDWRSAPHSGIVSHSVVAFAVRKGNPEEIHDWPDLLLRPHSLVMPDPKSSGGGRWSVCATYGAALRGYAGVAKGDPGTARAFLARLLRRIDHLDKDARESFKTFEGGAGDVALTSESEVIRGRMFGHDYELVIPRSTLRMDNPVAIVDAHAEKHGVLEVARGFLEYLWTPEAQRAYAFYGFRPADDGVAAENAEQYPAAEDLWTIDDLGGWGRVSEEIFGSRGVAERAWEEASDQ